MKTKVTTSLGRSYTIKKKLGSGGMADVFLAKEEPSGLLVAIKELPARGLDRPETRERFHREAVTSGRLRHPNIIKIRDLALEQTPPFFVMDFAPGGSLADRIRRNPSGMPEEEIIAITRQILDALDYAHRQRVIHRDIKPENILFDAAGRVVVSDFGLARTLDDKTLTRQGALLGTPYYNSPELARGRKVYDGRCDLYSLGVILYELATGHVPFDGVDAVSVCHRHVFEPPRPPRSLRTDLSEPLERMILKALEKQSGDRYQSAADMLADLERIGLGQDIEYDPLPGVIALLNQSDDLSGTPLANHSSSSNFFTRFLFGSADQPPEPAAGLLVGAFLALVLWTGLSALHYPQNGDKEKRIALSTTGNMAMTREVNARGRLSKTQPEPRLRRLVVTPLEDRSGNPELVRLVEKSLADTLNELGTTTIPSADVYDWQRRKDLPFSKLFTPANLKSLKNTFSATHFVTGVVLRANKTSLELELTFYRFKDRANVLTLKEFIKFDGNNKSKSEALSQLLSRRLFPIGATNCSAASL